MIEYLIFIGFLAVVYIGFLAVQAKEQKGMKRYYGHSRSRRSGSMKRAA